MSKEKAEKRKEALEDVFKQANLSDGWEISGWDIKNHIGDYGAYQRMYCIINFWWRGYTPYIGSVDICGTGIYDDGIVDIDGYNLLVDGARRIIEVCQPTKGVA